MVLKRFKQFDSFKSGIFARDVESFVTKNLFSSWVVNTRVRPGFSCMHPLRKQAYSNILKISPPKTESFQIKILIFFHISAQNIDCGYSLEPPR